ncbi:hypothetical protein DTL42_16060 [Bremerella cremea]|uniref:Uncharacterized protein n=1 Tax=Bremerella cremea TaxID=1031537 RepID=A0A368KPQ8_9BACT|nr:hypothetical protein [Bremerella cremea]RCS46470.1 hypothetical protein DTL42_16060 [Bremerella cremea]
MTIDLRSIAETLDIVFQAKMVVLNSGELEIALSEDEEPKVVLNIALKHFNATRSVSAGFPGEIEVLIRGKQPPDLGTLLASLSGCAAAIVGPDEANHEIYLPSGQKKGEFIVECRYLPSQEFAQQDEILEGERRGIESESSRDLRIDPPSMDFVDNEEDSWQVSLMEEVYSPDELEQQASTPGYARRVEFVTEFNKDLECPLSWIFYRSIHPKDRPDNLEAAGPEEPTDEESWRAYQINGFAVQFIESEDFRSLRNLEILMINKALAWKKTISNLQVTDEHGAFDRDVRDLLTLIDMVSSYIGEACKPTAADKNSPGRDRGEDTRGR